MKFFLTGVLTMITCMVLHATDTGGNLVFYGDAKVNGKENVFVYQDSSLKAAKTAKLKKRASVSETIVKDNITKQQESPIVIPDFPFTPASSSYFTVSRESATIVQQKTDEYSQAGKTACREKTYPHIKDSDFLTYHHPKQRHKLSVSATQCGMLTSFGSNYPPVFFLKRCELSSRA